MRTNTSALAAVALIATATLIGAPANAKTAAAQLSSGVKQASGVRLSSGAQMPPVTELTAGREILEPKGLNAGSLALEGGKITASLSGQAGPLDPEKIALRLAPTAEGAPHPHTLRAADVPGKPDFLAAAGTWWNLPASQAGLLLHTATAPEGTDPATLTISLTKTEGPGQVEIWRENPAPQRLLTSTDPTVALSLQPGTQAASLNWSFSKPGTYRLTLEPAARDNSGKALAGKPLQLIWLVGTTDDIGLTPADNTAATANPPAANTPAENNSPESPAPAGGAAPAENTAPAENNAAANGAPAPVAPVDTSEPAGEPIAASSTASTTASGNAAPPVVTAPVATAPVATLPAEIPASLPTALRAAVELPISIPTAADATAVKPATVATVKAPTAPVAAAAQAGTLTRSVAAKPAPRATGAAKCIPTRIVRPATKQELQAAAKVQAKNGNAPTSRAVSRANIGPNKVIPKNTHVHPNWVFSHPGTYVLGIKQTGITNDGKTVSGTTTLTFKVGGAGNANSGHFDLGAQLINGKLVPSIKDDRVPGGRWTNPRSLTFGLGNAAKVTAPAGMEFIAPAGAPVWMIGSSQVAGVPWLGANTQHPSVVTGLSSGVKWSLTSVRGPGTVAVFTSGNFGRLVGDRWFTASGSSRAAAKSPAAANGGKRAAQAPQIVTVKGKKMVSEIVGRTALGQPCELPALAHTGTDSTGVMLTIGALSLVAGALFLGLRKRAA